MSSRQRESEIALYAHLEDPESLMDADLIEDHIQLESQLVSGDKIRVRKITPVKGGVEGGSDRYEITLKVKTEDDAGVPSSYEGTENTDRLFYELFAEAAKRAIVKRRFVFIGRVPVIEGLPKDLVLPPVKYEIDQFIIPATKEKASLVKVDIELDGILQILRDNNIDTSTVHQKFNLKNLPMTLTDMYTPTNMSEEQSVAHRKFWDEVTQKLRPDVFIEQQQTKE